MGFILSREQVPIFLGFLWLITQLARGYMKRCCNKQRHRYQPTAYQIPRDFFGLRELKEASNALRSRKLLERSCEQYQRYGTTFTSRTVFQTTFHTIDPENIKAILSTRFKDYGVGRRRQNAFRPLLGFSLFQLDGDAWVRSRSLLHGIFRNNKGQELLVVEDHVQHLLENIRSATSASQQVDLAPHFFRLSTNIAASYIHGKSDRASEKEQNTFLKAMERVGEGCERRWQLGILTPLVPQRRFYHDMRTVQQYIRNHVNHVLESSSGTISKPRSSFLTALAEHTGDVETLTNEACMLFIAATDTVGSTLTNLFFMIGTEPRIWERLRLEVQFLSGQPPNATQLKQLKYHGQCVKESLRLHPVVPSNSREAYQDTVLPVGGGHDGKSPILIPSGSIVRFSIMALHRRRDIWGADAEDFLPERWEDPHPEWSFIPFQRGPRICLGHEIALNEITYVLARLVQHFRSCTRTDSRPWVENMSFGVSSADGAKVILTPEG